MPILDIRFQENTPSVYRRTSSGTEGQIEGDDKANNYFLRLFYNASRQKEQRGTKYGGRIKDNKK